jgi:hypothetical protein
MEGKILDRYKQNNTTHAKNYKQRSHATGDEVKTTTAKEPDWESFRILR